jgi:hypothetical protein
VLLWELSFNIFFPYIIILQPVFLETGYHHLLPGDRGGAPDRRCRVAWPFGLLVDRWGRKPVALCAILLEMIGLMAYSQTRTVIPLILTGILWLAPFTAWRITCSTWGKKICTPRINAGISPAFPHFLGHAAHDYRSLNRRMAQQTYGIKTVIDGRQPLFPPHSCFRWPVRWCFNRHPDLLCQRHKNQDGHKGRECDELEAGCCNIMTRLQRRFT